MKRRLFWLLLGLLAVLVACMALGLGPFGRLGTSPAPAGKVRVTASFYTMAEFARQVGGDRVDVTTMIPAGVEPHEFLPTTQDIAGAYKSQVFVYNGAGLEPWADKISGDLGAGGVVVVNASDGIDLMAGEGSAYDPHVWLDPVLAQREVDNIRDGLIRADPKDRSVYEQNAAAYNQKLAALDGAFRSGLASCARRDIVTSHQAFTYLGKRYGLDVMAISGLSPDEEPPPQKLAEVAQFARQHNIHYIFFERLVNPKLSQTIATEVGAQTLVFDPLEGLTQQEAGRGEDYLSVQRENLANLRRAMECGS
ncbi:MAG: metal ABC transporter substrate-binding protein [Thermoleophilia bacterium]